MKLGCSTLLFGDLDLRQALDEIAAIGFKAVELCTIPGMAEHLFLEQPDDYYQGVRRSLEQRGLTLESVGASTSLVDEGGRERFKKAIEAAAKIGAPYITSGSGGVSDDEESFAQTVAAIKEVAAVGQQLGVKISIKPHVRAAVYDSKSALRMLEEVGSDFVGINFDPTHIFRVGEDPLQALEALKDHIFTLRFRDTASTTLDIGPVEGQIPGRGRMPVDEICQAYKALAAPDIVTLEIVGTKGMELEQVRDVVKQCYEYMAAHLGG